MDYRPIGREGPRYSFRGAVEPNVCQWASTVVSRHRVGGPRSLAKALPYATGTAMCTIYPFSLSLSLSVCISLRLSFSLAIRHSASSFEFLQISSTTAFPFDQIIFKARASSSNQPRSNFPLHLSYVSRMSHVGRVKTIRESSSK